MKPRLPAALAALALLLAACGGGGGDVEAPPSARFGPSSDYAGICTPEGQKQFIRAYMDEVYLWYDEIPQVDASRFGSIPDYFRALLVTTPDASGQPKDRYSTVLASQQARIRERQAFAPPVPAGTAALLGAGADGSVPVVHVTTSPAGRRTGYVQFNDHDAGAQDALITAFRQLRAQHVQDLVLDLRYNSGGYVYIAATAASLVAGRGAEGQVFEELRYNDKRQAETAQGTLRFSSRVQYGETLYPRGTELPQLDLSRVYMLTSGQTCSSAESIINGLRGIDMEVVLVGGTTCGKPYGFRRRDNCGYAFYPVEFQGFNAKGFGDYTRGFQPTCRVQDNPAATAGGADDPLLAAALHHIDHGACPADTATGVLQAGDPPAPQPGPARPAWLGRILIEEP